MSLQEFASAEEAAIATALVDAALVAGYSLSVHDGEEVTIIRSRDRDAVLSALATTDSDRLRFYREDGTKMGFAWLIWGNGGDLISDWAANDECDSLVSPVALGDGE